MTHRNMRLGQLLAECFQLLLESGVCPETSPREWVPLLLYLHRKGWLFASAGPDGHVNAVACAYRVPNLSDQTTDVLPRIERGGILYVPFYASKARQRMTALRLLRSYLKDNGARVREVAFHRLKDKRLKRFKVTKGGLVHV